MKRCILSFCKSCRSTTNIYQDMLYYIYMTNTWGVNMYNILIVDDEKIERSGIIFLLKKLNIAVNIYEAANGKAAFELLQQMKEKQERIDILLTDVKMPFMDGIELINAVKEADIHMKTIIFSGYNEFEYAKLAVRLGVSDYILKPVNPKEFENTMHKVIQELEQESLEKEQMQQRSDYMKEYILYTLFNGGNPDDMKEKAQKLVSEEFWNRFHRIMLIEFDSDFFGKEVLDFSKEIMKVLESGEQYQYLNLNPQQAVLLLNSTEQYGNLLKLAEKLHDVIYDSFGCHCHIAISGEVVDYSQLPKTMDLLERLMENKFYQPEIYVYTDGVSEETPALVQTDDDTLMKQMKQDIKMKDISSLREHFDRLCDKYKKKSYFSQIYVKFIFSNLLKDFYANLPNVNDEQFNKEIDKLYTSGDFNCIMEIVKRHIDMLEEAFEQNPQLRHREIETVKKYIYEHYKEELGVEQLADMVYLAPSYLSSVFKKETGQNLSKFIKQYRMERAKDMLENTNMKIVAVSEAVGYQNVSYFCQSFRECFGVSPQRYRENGI